MLLFVIGCQSETGTAPITGLASASGAGGRRLIVVFQPSVPAAAQDAVLAHAGAAKLKSLPLVNAAAALVPPAAEQALRGRAEVLRIDVDALAFATGKPAPSQPAETLPWGVNRIDADLAWTRTTGTGVKVAVVDTGIDLTHPDLAANIAGGVNCIYAGKSPADDNGHGTHVAGTIAAIDNSIGVIGVAPKASFYAVKVLDRTGSGYISDIIEGIQWCTANGIKVINMSLGASVDVPSFHDAVTAAYKQGIVIVAAAGNSGPGDYTVNYPAKYAEVIAVSAVDSTGTITSWSSRGPEVCVAAPGASITSTYMGSTYKVLSGTSMASPHVAGVAALVVASGTTDPAAVRSILQQTADTIGGTGSHQYGYGLVDAEQAATGVQTAP
jgi:subtilisin family serine protease